MRSDRLELLDRDQFLAAAGVLGEDLEVAHAEWAAQARRQVAVLREQSHDARACHRAAHTLAASSTMLGYRAMGDQARAVESRVEGASPQERCLEGQRLQTVLDASIGVLHDLFADLHRALAEAG